MRLSEFQDGYKRALQLVRLHGWVVQAEEQIQVLREACASPGEEGQACRAVVQEGLPGPSASSDKVLSLCVLRDGPLDSAELAGLLFQHLEGGIDAKDGDFLVRQFFRKGHPLPSEVAAAITDRAYLTYQRALLQAMKIQQFSSSYDAPQIVLYMTLLLCRRDLNQQNKAMLYLLLSRIDSPLPETLNQAVGRAMVDLREVIQEVELKRENVLSEQFPSFALAPGEPRPTQPGSQAPTVSQKSYGFSWNPVPPPQPGTKAEPLVSPARSPIGSSWGSWPQPQTGPPGPTAPGFPATPVGKTPSRAPFPFPEGARSGSPPNVSGPASTVSAPEQVAQGIPSALVPESRGAPRGQAPRNSAGAPEEETTFVIEFNQERPGWETLLKGLDAEPPHSGAEPAPPASARKKRKHWWILGVPVALALVGALWFFSGQEHPAVPVSSHPGTVIPVVEAAPPAGGLDIRNEPQGSLWYPRPGESVWTLYQFLRSQPHATVDSWKEFQDQIVRENRQVSRAELIYPKVPLRFDGMVTR